MANEQGPKSNENPLTEVAKTIGSTLGTAANRANAMMREVMPATLSEKLGIESAPKTGPSSAKAKTKPKPKKKAAAKSTKKRTTSARKAVARKKAPARKAAKKKASR